MLSTQLRSSLTVCPKYAMLRIILRAHAVTSRNCEPKKIGSILSSVRGEIFIAQDCPDKFLHEWH